MTDDKENKYAVGYGNPPTQTRFKKGQSGNPKGRPKGSVSLEKLLEDELARPVTVRENERRLRISKRKAIIKSLVNKAIKGDIRAAQLVLSFGKDDAAETDLEALRRAFADEDRALLDRVTSRQANATSDPDNTLERKDEPDDPEN